jgi:hypothetical protein
MDFTKGVRKNNLVLFTETFAQQYLAEDNDDYFYSDRMDLFNTRYLSKGIEGKIYLSTFKNNTQFNKEFVIKEINLLNIKESKEISKFVLKATPHILYNLVLTNKAFNKPSLTEIITHTLTNQLILQNICPNYAMNYYWDYENKTVNIYNEYVNYGNFDTWAKANHTIDEWNNALFQIMVGLLAMKRYFGMLHTDFHTKNILVQKVQAGGYWVYIIDGFKYHLPNLGYVFLINDFGFSWIKNKLFIKWHERQTLQYITKAGMHFYDISIFIKQLLSTKKYNLPVSFKEFLKTSFYKEEISYTLSHNYYKKWLNHKQEKYKSITKDYNGVNTTLAQKVYSLFYSQYKIKNTSLDKIEAYSLDKAFDKSKLPINFKQFIK